MNNSIWSLKFQIIHIWTLLFLVFICRSKILFLSLFNPWVLRKKKENHQKENHKKKKKGEKVFGYSYLYHEKPILM
jgi:hypothetical protein